MFRPRYGLVNISWAGIILTIVWEFFVVLWSSILVGVCRGVWRKVFTLPYCFSSHLCSLAWLEFQQRYPQFLFCQLRSFVLEVTMLPLLYSCNLQNYLFRSCSSDNYCSHLYKDEAVCVCHIHRVSQRLSGKIV